jgi:hypothetical protein
MPLARLALVLALVLSSRAERDSCSWASDSNDDRPEAATRQNKGGQVRTLDGTAFDEQSLHNDVNSTAAAAVAATKTTTATTMTATISRAPTKTLTSDGHSAKPPRGYCVRISRAVKPTSRCYKHLVASAADQRERTDKRFTRATANDAPPPPPPPPGPQRPAANEGPTLTTWARRHEELVYVRSETLGDKITNLSTQAINEHLINGLLDRLNGERRPQIDASSSIGAAGGEEEAAAAAADETTKAAGADEKIRMQIMRSLSPECRLAIEKFLCRLVYPSCHFRSIDVVALVRPPCREDCLLLREHICAGLNWTQFSRTIEMAFKTTLMSTINALDLLVDGDLSAATQAPSMPLRYLLPLAKRPEPSEKLADENAIRTATPVSKSGIALNLNHHQVGGGGQFDADSPKPPPGSGGWWLSSSSVAAATLNHSISSSIHFYWPHERSIERCESLPMLWPPGASVGAADIGPRTKEPASRHSASGPKSAPKFRRMKRWMHEHRAHSYWPVCSDAHLTETNAPDELDD